MWFHEEELVFYPSLATVLSSTPFLTDHHVLLLYFLNGFWIPTLLSIPTAIHGTVGPCHLVTFPASSFLPFVNHPLPATTMSFLWCTSNHQSLAYNLSMVLIAFRIKSKFQGPLCVASHLLSSTFPICILWVNELLSVTRIYSVESFDGKIIIWNQIVY